MVSTLGFKGLQSVGVCLIECLPATFLFLKVWQTPVDFLQTDRDLRVGTFPLLGRSEFCLSLRIGLLMALASSHLLQEVVLQVLNCFLSHGRVLEMFFLGSCFGFRLRLAEWDSLFSL